MIKAIAIDDEEYANAYLKSCCSNIPFLKLIGLFTDPFAAIPLLNSGQIDLLFLDFNMAGVSAPEFIPYVPEIVKINIISSELAPKIEAYDLRISSIVSKPFPCERLLAACQDILTR